MSKIRGVATLLLPFAIILGLMTVQYPASHISDSGPRGLALLNCVYTIVAAVLAGIVIVRGHELLHELSLVCGIAMMALSGCVYVMPKSQEQLLYAVFHPMLTPESLLFGFGFIFFVLAHMIPSRQTKTERVALALNDVRSLWASNTK